MLASNGDKKYQKQKNKNKLYFGNVWYFWSSVHWCNKWGPHKLVPILWSSKCGPNKLVLFLLQPIIWSQLIVRCERGPVKLALFHCKHPPLKIGCKKAGLKISVNIIEIIIGKPMKHVIGNFWEIIHTSISTEVPHLNL